MVGLLTPEAPAVNHAQDARATLNQETTNLKGGTAVPAVNHA